MASPLSRAAALLPVAAVAMGGLLLIPGPAQAASGVNVSNGTLNVSAQAGKANKFSIQLNSTAGIFTVTDGGDTVTAGTGCTPVAANKVNCTATGVNTVLVNSFDGNDVVDARTTVKAIVNAGPGVDQVLGSSKNDVIDGGADADNLSGFDGADTLNGGDGVDSLNGGNDRDRMDGGLGADTFIGGADSDVATYELRSIRVVVDPDDVADDGQAGELDNVKSDVEEILGGTAGDTLTGTAVDNRLVGNEGDDTLVGLGGKDRLFGSEGSDTLNGGTEDDQLSGFTGTDLFSGGAGVDRILYDAHPAGVRVSLDGVTNDGMTGENENVPSDIEQINGSQFVDILKGNGVANRIIGLAGDDTLIGGPNVEGQDVADLLFGDFGNDRISGGAGDDSLNGGQDNDTLFGERGADDMFGDGGNDLVGGCALCGNDGAPDFMMGGSGIDTVTYVDHGAVNVALDGEANDGGVGEGDNAFDDFENLEGSLSGGDVLFGNELDNDIFGFGGDDLLFGEAGSDDLNCGAGTGDAANGGTGLGVDTVLGCESFGNIP